MSSEISNARAMALDEILQKFATAKGIRVEALGKLLQALMAELDKRDLSAVDTAALLKLALQYSVSLRADETPLSFTGKEITPDFEIDAKWTA